MVTSIRALEQSLGDSKKVYKKEKQIRKWAHRSIVSVNDIQKNQIIKQKDIWSKRPGTGIPSRYMNKVIGKKAKKFIKKKTILTKSQIGIKI